MIRPTTASLIAASIAVVVAATSGHAQPVQSAQSEGTMTASGITIPSTSIKLGFDIRGVVEKVDVKDNDKVKAGQPLISLNDIEQRATWNYYKLRADTALMVAEAEQTYNVRKIDYEKKKSLFENRDSPGAVAKFEVQTAEAEMNIAKIKIDQARHEAEVSQAQADAQEAIVKKMSKVSPIDGEIRNVIVKPGEQVDETKPVIEIVDLDPLYVEVTLVDTAVVQKLKLGDKVQVKYGDEGRWREAVVDRIDPVADVRSGKHPFRLSMPNPEMRNAGLRVEVQLPAALAKAN
jgi:RND family efflux transporter MFP subunit